MLELEMLLFLLLLHRVHPHLLLLDRWAAILSLLSLPHPHHPISSSLTC